MFKDNNKDDVSDDLKSINQKFLLFRKSLNKEYIQYFII